MVLCPDTDVENFQLSEATKTRPCQVDKLPSSTPSVEADAGGRDAPEPHSKHSRAAWSPLSALPQPLTSLLLPVSEEMASRRQMATLRMQVACRCWASVVSRGNVRRTSTSREPGTHHTRGTPHLLETSPGSRAVCSSRRPVFLQEHSGAPSLGLAADGGGTGPAAESRAWAQCL